MKPSETRWIFHLVLVLMPLHLTGCRTFNTTPEEVEAEQRWQFKSNPDVIYDRGLPVSPSKPDLYKSLPKSFGK